MKKLRRGFTLLETLMVVAIISILSSVAIRSGYGILRRVRELVGGW